MTADRTPTKPPQAPKHLSAEARNLWSATATSYEMEERHLVTLTVGCEVLDRMREAQVQLKLDGSYIEGRFGMKGHPALSVERDSRLAMMRAFRELGLDLEEPAAPRPPSRWQG